MLANSAVYKKIDKGELLCGQAKDGICPFVIGDSAYPLQPWLIKLYPHSGSLTAQQKLQPSNVYWSGRCGGGKLESMGASVLGTE